MKVIITIPCLLKGGTEQQSLQLINALKKDAHEVLVVCYYEFDMAMVHLFEAAGSEVLLLSSQSQQRPNGFKQLFFIFTAFKKIIQEYKPDVVHVQYMAPGAIPIFAAKWCGVKKILATVHQPYTASHGRLSKLLLKFSAYLSSRFMVVSMKSEESWFGSSTLYDDKIPLKKLPKHVTMYNAIDINRIQEIKKVVNIKSGKQKQEIPEPVFVFGAVSRLRHEKGIDVLLKAFYKLTKKNRNVHLHIVGDGPDEAKLKRSVLKLRLSNKVTFFGEASWEMAMQQMTLMDVVVVPSRFEGFGLTAAEAGAMGKPVIASKVFGLQEVVQDQYTGLLFENENVGDLYEKMKVILLDDDEYEKCSLNSIQFVQKFGLSVFEQKTQSLYKQL